MERPGQSLGRPGRPSPQQTPREYEERREHKGHQDIAGGCNEWRTDAKQGVRHRHPANVDGEKHAPERQHPHQIGGAYRMRRVVNLSMQLGECLVRRKAEPRVRVDGRCAGGRIGRRRLSRRHQHPPPSGRDVGTNDDADRQLRADDAAEMPEQRRACEIDQPADDRRDALRWRPAPGGQDFAEAVDHQDRNEDDLQAAEDERGTQDEKISGEQREHARQVGANLVALGRPKSRIGLRHAQNQ